MSRHNRRRTRTSHRYPNFFPQPPAFNLPDLESIAVQPTTATGPCGGIPKRSDLAARHWHNRYNAWLVWEWRQREEREKLLAEQKRIFGGENEEEDNDGLCSNMMKFFVGLDFIIESDGQEYR